MMFVSLVWLLLIMTHQFDPHSDGLNSTKIVNLNATNFNRMTKLKTHFNEHSKNTFKFNDYAAMHTDHNPPYTILKNISAKSLNYTSLVIRAPRIRYKSL